MTENRTSTCQQQGTGWEWLLQPLLDLPGVSGAVIAAQDGLKVAYTPRRPDSGTGIDEDLADQTASVISGLHGLARGLGATLGTWNGLQLALLKDAGWSLFVTSAGEGVLEGTPLGLGMVMRPGTVQCTLGVLTRPGADEGAVGHEMRQMVNRLGHVLRTQARRAGTVTDGGN
ncbi:roadblock/LC7 domain-containing protein [Streptomyces sp. NPDC091377]|uniref:roadblock/LC7 domain-containing protein n=1 Tax=Streptomyces sp. NPDC091377 TaxID=3365995 RepID=UPI0038098F10